MLIASILVSAFVWDGQGKPHMKQHWSSDLYDVKELATCSHRTLSGVGGDLYGWSRAGKGKSGRK